MSDRENEILEAVAEALPEMDERSKGYFLGYAEAMVEKKKGGKDDDGSTENADSEPVHG